MLKILQVQTITHLCSHLAAVSTQGLQSQGSAAVPSSQSPVTSSLHPREHKKPLHQHADDNLFCYLLHSYVKITSTKHTLKSLQILSIK